MCRNYCWSFIDIQEWRTQLGLKMHISSILWSRLRNISRKSKKVQTTNFFHVIILRWNPNKPIYLGAEVFSIFEIVPSNNLALIESRNRSHFLLQNFPKLCNKIISLIWFFQYNHAIIFIFSLSTFMVTNFHALYLLLFSITFLLTMAKKSSLTLSLVFSLFSSDGSSYEKLWRGSREKNDESTDAISAIKIMKVWKQIR